MYGRSMESEKKIMDMSYKELKNAAAVCTVIAILVSSKSIFWAK